MRSAQSKSITLPLKLASDAASHPISSGNAHAIEMAHEGVPLVVIQASLDTPTSGSPASTSKGIDSSDIINTVRGRPSPTISANAGLQITR